MNAFMGPTTALATASEFARPMLFGTSSPMTTEKKETISVIATTAKGSARSAWTPMLISQVPNGAERLVAANAEDAKPTRVIATWIVARKYPRSVAMSMTARALGSPSSTSASSAARRELTMAISAAEKKPFTRVSSRVIPILNAMSIECMGTYLFEVTFLYRLLYSNALYLVVFRNLTQSRHETLGG